ncbi:MAG: Ig-like domain-containing protein [Prevotellaceae bacterium]|nr:Ig-like domain-containing protein [Prevotellaceae bacterium]
MVRVLQFFVLLLAVVLLTGRCANVAQGPSGGPKDTIPPVLLATMPEFYAVNQSPSKVILRFNEYVQVKDAARNVVVSPPSLQRPEIRLRGKTVQVVFDDTLKTNATYTIDFGASISDLNEGNLFPPFCFVFSTGATIDSMMLTGKVLDAYTKEPVPVATVALYEDKSDTAIYKTLPVAITRTDNWGYFTLQNIKPIPYKMVAFVDKNNNLKYDAGNEILAFLDSTVLPVTVISDYKTLLTAIDPKDTVQLLARPYEWELYTSTEKVGKQFLKDQELTGKRQITLVFGQPHAIVDSLIIKDINASDITMEHSRFSDTLIYWITAASLPDTLSAQITYHRTDSLDLLSPLTAPLRLQLKKEDKPDTKKDKDKEPEEPKLVPTINYSGETIMKQGVLFKFPTLLTQNDLSKIQLWEKDIKDKDIQTPEPFTLTADTVYLRQYRLQAKWQTGTSYELLLLPEAFMDIYGLVNDSITKAIITENPDKYSSMKFVMTGVDSAQIIVQLLSEKKDRILREEIITADGTVEMDYLRAGKYTLRLIRDDNRNGIWDPAIYLEGRQPELAEFYTLPDGKEVIELPDNTDITQQVNIIAVFTRNRKDELPKIVPKTLDEDTEIIRNQNKETETTPLINDVSRELKE